MKQFFLLVLLSGFASISFAQQTVISDANAEKRNVPEFHGIHVSGGIDLFVSQGSESGIAVSASETKYRDNIHTEVKDGVLSIWYESNVRHWSMGNKKMRAYVSVKDLDLLNASGASDVTINGTIKSNSLELHLSGASDLKGAIDVGTLKANISGASDMIIKGTAGTVKIDASGASDFKGFDLVTQNCDVEASGASDIKITCDKEINATANGASDIHFKGNGVIRALHSSGASSVKKV